MAIPDYRETKRDAFIVDAIYKYQRKLALLDWDIRYDPEWTSKNDLESATITGDLYSRSATLRIRDNVPDRLLGQHIVHELFHLVFKEYAIPANHVIAKAGAGGLGMLDHLADMEERICETVAFALTGTPWEPVGKKPAKWHRPFLADHIASASMRTTT